MNRPTDSFDRSRASGSSPSERGSSSGGIRSRCSPGTDSGSRLVAMTRTPDPVRSRSVTSCAAARSRCSQLSTRSSTSRSRTDERSRSRGSVAAWSRRSRPSRAALATSAGSVTSASSTSHAPSRKPRARSVPIRSARRVLPTPPGPTRVISRVVRSSFRSSAISRRRPMKLAVSAGRFPGRRSGLAMVERTVLRATGPIAGHSDRSPAARTDRGPWGRSRGSGADRGPRGPIAPPNHDRITNSIDGGRVPRRRGCGHDADAGSAGPKGPRQ